MNTFQPVIAGKYVIVGSTTGLRAVSASDGMERWRWPGGGHVFSPAATESAAFVTDRAGHAASLDLETGEVLWQRSFVGWLYTPALVAGKAITGGQAGVVRALDVETGETLWRTELDQELVYRPVALGDGVVVTTFSGSIFRLDDEGGTVWQARSSSPSFSPAVAGDLLLFGGMDGVLRARDARTGRLRWRVALSGKLSLPARAHAHEVAIVSPSGTLAVIDAADGKVLTRKKLQGVPLGSPVWSGGWRVIQREAGIIRWADAS